MPEKDEQAQKSRGFWLFWTIATAVGAAAAGAVLAAVSDSYEGPLVDTFLVWPLLVGLFCLPMGVAQSLVLWRASCSTRQWALSAALWILTCSLGWAVGYVGGALGGILLGTLFYLLIGDPSSAMAHPAAMPSIVLVFGLFPALTVSVLQQRVLSARFAVPSGWTRSSALSWYVAWCVGFAVGHFVPVDDLAKWIIGGAVAGIVAGVLTGRTLTRLLSAPQNSVGEFSS